MVKQFLIFCDEVDLVWFSDDIFRNNRKGHSLVIRPKGDSQNGCSSTPNFPKNEHFLPSVMRARTCAYQRIKNNRFSENRFPTAQR